MHGLAASPLEVVGDSQGNGGGGGSDSADLFNDDLRMLGGVDAGNDCLALELRPAAVAGVPEPGSLAWFGAGVIGLVVTRRKTRPGCDGGSAGGWPPGPPPGNAARRCGRSRRSFPRALSAEAR